LTRRYGGQPPPVIVHAPFVHVICWKQQCNYAEGQCYCGIQQPCSGAARSDDELAQIPTSWQCTAIPPVVRPDGCPGQMPSEGRPCSPSGRTCTYGSCCVHELSCIKGSWKMTHAECPP
jgi:hypothetical protein